MEVILRMSLIDWIIFWLSIGAYIPLIVGIVKNRFDQSQVFTTWFLYFLLDFILMLSTNKVDGNYVILFGFASGSFIMFAILFYQMRVRWTWIEYVLISLITLCIMIWYISGPYYATICGIIAESLTGIYLIIRTWKNPVVKYNLLGYSIFLIVSIISLVNAKNLSIEQIGFPISEIILSSIILIPLIKKYREE